MRSTKRGGDLKARQRPARRYPIRQRQAQQHEAPNPAAPTQPSDLKRAGNTNSAANSSIVNQMCADGGHFQSIQEDAPRCRSQLQHAATSQRRHTFNASSRRCRRMRQEHVGTCTVGENSAAQNSKLGSAQHGRVRDPASLNSRLGSS